MFPTRVETIVHPHAAASSAGFGVPSESLATTSTVARLYHSAISAAVRLVTAMLSTSSSSHSTPSSRSLAKSGTMSSSYPLTARLYSEPHQITRGRRPSTGSVTRNVARSTPLAIATDGCGRPARSQ